MKMDARRLEEITARYGRLSIAVLGDVCLDRYLEIDPQRQETSLETGLPVYNVTRVRAQPGAGGTVINNLAALGVGRIVPIGFAGEDGEGYELLRTLRALRGVCLDGFVQTPLRRTFTYCKPLVLEPGHAPRELNRLDSKNWTPTPPEVEGQLIEGLRQQAAQIDGLIVMDQVDLAETGVVTRRVLEAVDALAQRRPELQILADSRRGLGGYPAVGLKMNRVELGKFLGVDPPKDLAQTRQAVQELARRHGRNVIVTMAEEGLLGATAAGEVAHFGALPLRGPIDIVGAGDAVTANLTVALAVGARLAEALQLANAAASVVVHQLGTTGTASVAQIAAVLQPG